MQWLVPLEDLRILQDLIPPDTYYWENRALVLEWQCDLVVDSTIDEKSPLESLDQEEAVSRSAPGQQSRVSRTADGIG